MSFLLYGAPNARDLGGMLTADGRKIKPHRLIRSGMLGKLSSADIEYLKSIDLKTVVDFRGEQEQVEKPDLRIEGVSYVSCPILKGRTDGISRLSPKTEDEEARRTVDMARRLMREGSDGREKMRFLYTLLVSDAHAVEHYGMFFDTLLSQENGALLYHCMMGKDRVGVGTALLLSALGVSRENIIKDYLITAERCAPGTARLLENCRRYTDDEAELRFIYDLDIVDESFISAGLDCIERSFGGMDAYMRDQLRLDDEKREKLKNMYLE